MTDIILPNTRMIMDGHKFLSMLPEATAHAAFLDPDWPNNKGGMELDEIRAFIKGIDRSMKPGSYLFLWADKFSAHTGLVQELLTEDLQVVDSMVWDRQKKGNGHRTLGQSSFIFIIQKWPVQAGTWFDESLGDCWGEFTGSPWRKPIKLQQRLIEAVTREGQIVLDPCSGISQ